MARAVETVATYAVLGIQLVGQGIRLGADGPSLVEGWLKHYDLGDLWQQCAHGVHSLDIGRIV